MSMLRGVPLSSKSRSRFTVSSLQVRVPVLSVAITVQAPRPSMAGRARTMTLRRAMRLVAMVRATVMATGRPSGMAATARATATRNTVTKAWPCRSWIAARAPIRTRVAIPMIRLKRSSWRIRGGGSSGLSTSACAMRPISVRAAVATTTPSARPCRTVVPAKSRLRLSATGSASGRTSAGVLATGVDSPVNRGLVEPQVASRQQAQVGGDPRTALQPDDVSGHQDSGVQRQPGPVAPCGGGLPDQGVQGRRAALRLAFLQGADGGVELQDDEDEDGIRNLTDADRNQGGEQQQVDQGGS